ncbi:conserved protein of unknown function [Cyanobium sp. NIES-981]|nr:conserved protein of unknown function [Cyanobium sp. NIES-981]
MRQLLLLPLLAPLLAVVLIGAVNPRPAVALRLLTWSTPSLPIGVWMMLAAAGGAGVSALGTALAMSAGERELQRQVRRPLNSREANVEDSRQPSAPPRETGWPGMDADSEAPAGYPPAYGPGAGPTRAAGESSPTVAVPYRVIRRAGATTASPAQEHPASPRPERGFAVAAPTPGAAGGDGWGSPLAESW